MCFRNCTRDKLHHGTQPSANSAFLFTCTHILILSLYYHLPYSTLQQLSDGPIESPAHRRYSHTSSAFSSHRTALSSDRDLHDENTVALTAALQQASLSVDYPSSNGHHATGASNGSVYSNCATTEESNNGENTNHTIDTNDSLVSNNSQAI